jgi:hypothetical protein
MKNEIFFINCVRGSSSTQFGGKLYHFSNSLCFMFKTIYLTGWENPERKKMACRILSRWAFGYRESA